MKRWTWEEARDAYLADVARRLRPATANGYRQFLNHPALAPLAGRQVADMTRQGLAEIVADVFHAGAETQATNMANVLRPMWSFLSSDHVVGRSGLEPGTMALLRAPKRSRISTGRRKERTPSLEQVGRVLAMARSGVLNPVMAAAIEITMLTVQRRFSVVQAKRSLVSESDGFRVWRLPLDDLKTGEHRVGSHGETIPDHEIPLTDASWAAFGRAMAVETDTNWLFPQTRPKRRGDPVSHLNESSLTHAVGELPDASFSPHDVRRAFTTTIRQAGFPRGSASLILDHSEGRSDDTTARHYDRYRELAEKLRIMQAWSDAVEAAAAKVVVDVEALREHLAKVRKRRTKKTARKAGDDRRTKTAARERTPA